MSTSSLLKLDVAAICNDSVAVLGWNWQKGEKIAGCLGFAITRINQKTGQRKLLESTMPFSGERNKDWQSKPSTIWPYQRKWWIDFSGKTGETYVYEVQALTGAPGSLTAIPHLVGRSNPVTLSTEIDTTFQAAFTRGILSTQWLARQLGSLADGSPDFEKLIKAIEDYKSPDNLIRKHLAGNVPAMLLAPFKECVNDGGHVFAALYELHSRQLVDAIIEHKDFITLVLGNTGRDDETNKESRAELHAASVNIQDRMIGDWGIAHNKSLVKVNKDGNPTDVTTGSTNWTDTGMTCQSNLVVRINNPLVAKNFKDYFDRLKADGSEQSPAFRARNSLGYSPVQLDDGTVIETWFQPSMPEKTRPKNAPLSPFLKRVKGLMESAKDVLVGEVFYPGNPSVVHFMAEIWDKRPDLFMFMTASTPDAVRGVKAKRRKGRPPLFTIATGREAEFADFVKELLKLPDAHAITHGKIIVIDPWGERPVVIFGSDNLGLKASYGNDENCLIVLGNRALAQFVFANMFDLNKHFSARSAARSPKYGKSATTTKVYSGKLSPDDSWQDGWLDGHKWREARLLSSGIWEKGEIPNDPAQLKSTYVIPPRRPRPRKEAEKN